ncbi:MAG TPA: SpoIID/LytB domain-containing protein [Longimicrobiales bacterium]|nr:SpoIID/LytB domain-containing protein [Longimicrobiales bacterium]
MKLHYVGLVALVLAGCRAGEPTPGRPTTPTTPARTEPTVRIGLKVDTAAVTLATTTAAQLLDRDNRVVVAIPANERWTFTAAGEELIATAPTGAAHRTTGTPARLQPSSNGFVMVGDKPYRGEMLLRRAGNDRVTLINVLDMERYLIGVVPFEIGRPSGALEAIKAQAIAARTYAIGGMGSRNALGFDFYATVADQVYGGASGEDSMVSRAVLETRGEIITHQGEPIIAYYSSTCGGRTAAVSEVWPWRNGKPYLQSRSDMMPDGQTAYCGTSNRYRWNVTWSGDSLRHVLEQTLGTRAKNPQLRIARIDDVRITGTTPSGRAEAVNISADGVTHRIPADSIRWILRPDVNRSLNSSLLFDLRALAGAEGQPVGRLEVSGGGWGHGVGMCQVGAIGRARAGQNYREILSAYYTDVEITRLY